MTKSKVIMVNPEETTFGDSLIDRLEYLWNHEEVNLANWINEGEIVAIKTHFGSRNQTRHLRPMYIRKIVDLVQQAGGIPFVCEGVGLFWNETDKELTMANGPGYIRLANRHGFNTGAMNAPVITDDGMFGTEIFKVHIENGKHIKDVAMAMGLRIADKVLIISRFKGHDGGGFGGALKQLGIGCVGKEGKGAAHLGGGKNVYVKHPENCDGCGKCLRTCPYGCLSLDENNKIVLDNSKCIACTTCFSRCLFGKDIKTQQVFAYKRRISSVELAERIADNAAGVIKGVGPDRLRYINIAIDITSHCDCMTAGGHLLVPDQGILYSTDPIAIDQASIDLVTKAQGVPMSPAETGLDSPHGRIEANPKVMQPNEMKLGLYSRFVDPESRPIIVETQLDAARALEIGSREYDLKDITPKKEKK
ncbi:MAG: DUF362 domain-containing protein [Candidatus Hodarchaeota archaeon]